MIRAQVDRGIRRPGSASNAAMGERPSAMTLLDEQRSRDPHRGVGIATDPAPQPVAAPATHAPTPRRRDRPIAATAEHCPGFCARCNQPTPVRLGAGPDDLGALCRACRAAESGDRSAAGGSRRSAHR
jgi:hypothetical protein